MKKYLVALLGLFVTLGLVGCSQKAETPVAETITITALDPNENPVEVTVPKNPEKVVVLDYAALDVIDSIGEGDSVVGTSNIIVDYLDAYNAEDIAKLGSLKEPDLEGIMACNPDIIFIGGRMAKHYDALSEIAPVVFLQTDRSLGVPVATENNAKVIASIYGKEDLIKEKMAAFNDRLAALQEVGNGKTAVVGLTTGGAYRVVDNMSKCSLVASGAGFENLGNNVEKADGAHGNEVSFEYIVNEQPDYIFVMDRDAAIGKKEAAPAREIMNNELIEQTEAYKNGHIIYLEPAGVWYMAEGGITALDMMITDLETNLLNK